MTQTSERNAGGGIAKRSIMAAATGWAVEGIWVECRLKSDDVRERLDTQVTG